MWQVAALKSWRGAKFSNFLQVIGSVVLCNQASASDHAFAQPGGVRQIAASRRMLSASKGCIGQPDRPLTIPPPHPPPPRVPRQSSRAVGVPPARLIAPRQRLHYIIGGVHKRAGKFVFPVSNQASRASSTHTTTHAHDITSTQHTSHRIAHIAYRTRRHVRCY